VSSSLAVVAATASASAAAAAAAVAAIRKYIRLIGYETSIN